MWPDESGQIRTETGVHRPPYPSSTPEEGSEENQRVVSSSSFEELSGPSAEAHVDGQDLDQDPAAAAETECARESEIRSTVEALAGSDAGSFDQLYPLARQLPRSLFFDTRSRLEQRVASGHVRNQTGYFKSLLEVAVRELHRRLAHAAQAITAERTPIEHARFEAESYALGGHPWDVAAELISRGLPRVFPGITEVDVQQALAAGDVAYRAKERERRAA